MKICITGDSWACGEWEKSANGHYGVTHQGLEYFLSETHEVVNLGVGGSGNQDAIWRLMHSIKLNKFDYIFWFKTTPIRDMDTEKFLGQATRSFQDIIDLQNLMSRENYRLLNSLGVKVHCIGGCGKLNVSLMQPYTNLVPYIPCLSEMLEPRYQHPDVWISTWVNQINRQFDIDSLDLLLEEYAKRDRLATFKEHFWPDGGHPNRYSHKILYEKICKDFDL